MGANLFFKDESQLCEIDREDIIKNVYVHSVVPEACVLDFS